MRAPPLTPDADAYRRLNQLVLFTLLLTAAWQIGAHLLAVQIGRPLHACPSRAWLHVPCPLCGLTRGVVALFRGDLARAIAWNPLTPVAAVGYLLEILYRALGATPACAARFLRWRRTDRLLHQSLGVAFLLYAIAFHLHLML